MDKEQERQLKKLQKRDELQEVKIPDKIQGKIDQLKEKSQEIAEKYNENQRAINSRYADLVDNLLAANGVDNYDVETLEVVGNFLFVEEVEEPETTSDEEE